MTRRRGAAGYRLAWRLAWRLAFLSAGAAGCATAGPAWFGNSAAWWEVTSDHFVVQTDLDPARADTVTRMLEETRAAILAAAWAGSAAPRARMSVVAFQSDDELASFLGPRFQGARSAEVRTALFSSAILLAPTGARGEQAMRRALARHIGGALLPVQPAWLLEGLSRILETGLRYDPATQEARLAGAPPEAEALIKELPSLAAARLFQPLPADAAGSTEILVPPVSGLLVSYLLGVRRQDYDQLRSRLAVPEPRAWALVFADWGADRIDADLAAYLRAGPFTPRAWRVPPWDGAIATRRMLDTELHLMRAHLLAPTANPALLGGSATFRAELEEALREDPPALDALVLQYYADPAAPGQAPGRSGRALARQARALYPGSWMTWVMVADTEGYQTAGGEEALARAVALAPDEPQVLTRFAYRLTAQGRWAEALEISTGALHRRAVDPGVLVLHVRALAHVGRCDEAAAWAAALSLHSSAVTVSSVGAEWRRLATICTAPTPTAAPDTRVLAVDGSPPPAPRLARPRPPDRRPPDRPHPARGILRDCPKIGGATGGSTGGATGAPTGASPAGGERSADADSPPEPPEPATAALSPAEESLLKARLRSAWHPEAAWKSLEVQGAAVDPNERLTVVEMMLAPGGQLEDLCISASAGIRAIDEVGWNAVIDATSVPWPADGAAAHRRLRFQFGFQYLPPPPGAGPGGP